MNHSSESWRIDVLLDQADVLLRQGGAEQAARLIRSVLELAPDHAEAHYMLGLALQQSGDKTSGLAHLEHACKLEPDCADFLVHLARALAQSRRSREALETANRAAALAPERSQTFEALGSVYGLCNAHERALAAFRHAVELAPKDAGVRFNYAVSLSFSGQAEAAEHEIDRCLEIFPHHWRALEVRSRLRRQTTVDNHLVPLHRLLDEAGTERIARSHLHMALGKEFEDLGNYSAAFEHYILGNQAQRKGITYDIDNDRAAVRALIDAFGQPLLKPEGLATDEPIFIVGMPRSGTTLVERIVSNHPEVHAAGELLDIPSSVELELDGIGFARLRDLQPEHLASLDWRQLGLRYLEATRPATALKPRFTDKFPHNFFYLGFIARALPRARIICLRRDPLDTCLSNFREHFTDSSPFHGYASDLLDTGHYFILFDALMKHWKKVLPTRILEVGYESLVETPEREVRRILDYCGLPWNDACLQFERNRSPSSTASAVQVRSPIYRSAISRWRQYGAAIDPLRELLEEAGIPLGSALGAA